MEFIARLAEMLRNWAGGGGDSQASLQEAPALPVAMRDRAAHHTPVYPPTDPGIPFVEVDSIIASQEELIDRIMKAAALDAESAQYIPELIRNFAAYVHLLPASRMAQYPGNGGLFRMGLEVGFYALRASHGVIFASEIAEVRVKSNPRWRIATFVAGMLADTFRAVVLMRAITSDGAQWNPFTHPLATHLKQRGADRYYIKWMKDAQDNQAFNNLIVGVVVPHPMLSYLAELGPHIVGAMLEAISGSGTTPLSKTVQKIRSGLITRDVQANPNFIGRPMMGSHLEAHIIDVMRAMVRSGKWRANQNGQPLWCGADGIYLVIQTGWKDLYSGLMNAGFTGIPTDFDVVAEILTKAGVIVHNHSGGALFNIKLPTFEKATFEAVKISSGVTAFGDAYQGFERLDTNLCQVDAPSKDSPDEGGADPFHRGPQAAAPESKPVEPPKQSAASGKQGKGRKAPAPAAPAAPAQPVETSDGPPDITDILEAMDCEEPTDSNVPAEEKAAAGSHLNRSRWARYQAKLGQEVSQWVEDLITSSLTGAIKPKEEPDAFGFPAKTMDDRGLGRGIALTALVREGIIWIPPGEQKKVIEVDGEQYVFFNKRFWQEVTE